MADVIARNSADLERFYRHGTRERSLFHIWENGGSRGDSVTPSTFDASYRSWMADRVAAELDRTQGALLSLGCGNAAVEAELAGRGYPVQAIDAMPEAVELARAKGVDAERADIFDWRPRRTWSVAYIDGVLGHLNDPERGLVPVLTRIRSWLCPLPDIGGPAVLIASNDASNDQEQFQAAPGVDGFQWLSGEYMQEQFAAAGFGDTAATTFEYRRPLSGPRTRAIVAGTVLR